MEKGDVVFEYVDTKNRIATIFTKMLYAEPLHNCLIELGILDPSCFERATISDFKFCCIFFH